jgi:hypothetical protein
MEIKNLKKYQESFVNNITDKENPFSYLDSVVPVGKLSSNEVIEVYRTDYTSRLTEALGENFESIWAVVGDEEFFKICHNYITKYPSQKRDLTFYGSKFDDFLLDHKLSLEFSFLPKLAKLEIDFWNIFHSEKFDSLVDLNTALSDDFENLKISFPDNFKIMSWDHKLYDIWKQREDGLVESSISDYQEYQAIAIYKVDTKIQTKILSETQYQILDELMKEKTIGIALENIDESKQVDVQNLFQFFSESKVIKSIY